MFNQIHDALINVAGIRGFYKIKLTKKEKKAALMYALNDIRKKDHAFNFICWRLRTWLFVNDHLQNKKDITLRAIAKYFGMSDDEWEEFIDYNPANPEPRIKWLEKRLKQLA